MSVDLWVMVLSHDSSTRSFFGPTAWNVGSAASLAYSNLDGIGDFRFVLNTFLVPL